LNQLKQLKKPKMSAKNKILKITLIIIGLGLIIAGSVSFYLFNKPARNVQNTNTDFSLSASQIVTEYLTDAQAANDKYLDKEGNSKVLEISGTIAEITEDFNHQKVILLKSDADKAGVSCTFTSETNLHTTNLKLGDAVTIKGVIRSGAAYDEDLELYENVIIEKSDIVENK